MESSPNNAHPETRETSRVSILSTNEPPPHKILEKLLLTRLFPVIEKKKTN
jgi:hypothetical protein